MRYSFLISTLNRRRGAFSAANRLLLKSFLPNVSTTDQLGDGWIVAERAVFCTFFLFFFACFLGNAVGDV
jgi:hypothetical protein